MYVGERKHYTVLDTAQYPVLYNACVPPRTCRISGLVQIVPKEGCTGVHRRGIVETSETLCMALGVCVCVSSKRPKRRVHRVQAVDSPHTIWHIIGPDHFPSIESLQLCVIRKLQP